jgi:hypothetical protein
MTAASIAARSGVWSEFLSATATATSSTLSPSPFRSVPPAPDVASSAKKTSLAPPSTCFEVASIE